MEQLKSSNGGSEPTFDVAIIGAGVVGCAMARRFSLEGAKVVLLERGTDILSGASKGNSAILHTGFDAPVGSLEHQCVQNGYREYLEIRESMNLPVLKTGAHVVAWNESDLSRFGEIIDKARKNGIHNIEQISQSELQKREPNLASSAIGAIWVPGEYLIDPWSAPLAYIRQAVLNGATILRNSPLVGGNFDGQTWQLNTPSQSIKATSVINCSGLQGDELEKQMLGHCDFEMRPQKGQFVVFDKAAHHLISSIILPVPSARTKGIVITRTVFGNLLVGPTSEDQSDKDHAHVIDKTLEKLRQQAIARIPALAQIPITATYAGLRPASDRKEYRIKYHQQQHWLSVSGIRSTGLTGALGIAQHIYQLYSQDYQHQKIAYPKYPTMANLAEHLPRDWQKKGYQEMVCHCELVTKREIEQAFNDEVPPTDFGGLKRRTRACMGRCQGFYCSARVAELSKGRLQTSLVVKESVDD